ncbi:heat-shock protein Hsp20 [Candidatus Saccharibacteria bacterium QS_5_54_17]|nr:MAG: heat-shock protein Hsp20 [Candidatus Saccharibacteria bacterium QS_5_54_17]
MALIRGYDNPFRELEDTQNRLSNLFSETFGGQMAQPGLATPTADVYMDENDENMIIEASLPGFKEDDIEVNVEDNALNIRAEHRESQEGDGKKDRKYIVRESTSSFYRRIGLPQNTQTEDISASFEDGILTVTVPMQELPKPKQVTVESPKKNRK